MPSAAELERLLERTRAGDAEAINQLLALHRDRLRRMVALRLDPRLRGRVDASDVVQAAFLEICSRLPDFFSRERVPFLVWLRLEVGRHLLLVQRQHLGTAKRDVRREVSLGEPALPPASSVVLADELLARQSSPSQAAVQAERSEHLRQALESLDPDDREILTLRHFEMLNHRETAEVLGITEAASAKRYIRAHALARLEAALAHLPGGLEGL